VDADSLVYHITLHPQFGPACTQLLERVARQEVLAFTSTHVLGDVAHRVMTLEAITQFGWPAAGIARRLRQHPAEVQQLTRFRQAIEEVPQFGVQVLTVAPFLIATAASLSQQWGLLTGDALIVAIMQHHGLTNLASNDADFDRVPGLTRYAPA
jgi:predicted nucleic acid-binding protein